MDYSDILDIDKPVSHHKPMDIAHRAKIFAPFAALKGFEACIRQKEIVYYEYPVLSEDQKDSLNQKLQIIQCGQTITVTYTLLGIIRKDDENKMVDILNEKLKMLSHAEREYVIFTFLIFMKGFDVYELHIK